MNNGIPVGAVMAFATAKAPDGWLVCDGQEYLSDLYPDLFAAIGYIYGGNGKNTFCVPDLQGQFIRGWDRDGNCDSRREFGSFQLDCFQGHSHGISYEKEIETKKDGKHTHDYRVYKASAVTSVEGFRITGTVDSFLQKGTLSPSYGNDYWRTTDEDSDHSHRVSIGEIKIKTSTTANYGVVRESTETRPKNIALLYCIKAF